jgi:hypothetical protein
LIKIHTVHFERFIQADISDENACRAGLGLAIKAYVEMLWENMDEKLVQIGSTFYFTSL